MADLTDLNDVSGEDLSLAQIRGILQQIDLDVLNLVRDGKLAAAKYTVQGSPGLSTDRAANLLALLKARTHYEHLLQQREQQQPPVWLLSQVEEVPSPS